MENQDRAVDVPWRVRINTAFEFHDGRGGAPATVDPQGPAHLLGPALAVRHETLIDARLWADGRLRFQFENRTALDVFQDAQYEAWAVVEDTADSPLLLYAPIAPDTVDWNASAPQRAALPPKDDKRHAR